MFEARAETAMPRATIELISPFFIVSNVPAKIAFYCDRLGCEIQYQEPDIDPFFAIVQRDGSMVFLKHGSENVLPNPQREPGVKWDAYVLVDDPDALSADSPPAVWRFASLS
jgi:catechol 2,3-dioxygenase-like lactoylglutathione lyase family enzyme